MKKNIKERSPKNSEAINQKSQTSNNKLKQGGVNSSFPQEYEEQLSTNIRMKPQPLLKSKKREG